MKKIALLLTLTLSLHEVINAQGRGGNQNSGWNQRNDGSDDYHQYDDVYNNPNARNPYQDPNYYPQPGFNSGPGYARTCGTPGIVAVPPICYPAPPPCPPRYYHPRPWRRPVVVVYHGRGHGGYGRYGYQRRGCGGRGW